MWILHTTRVILSDSISEPRRTVLHHQNNGTAFSLLNCRQASTAAAQTYSPSNTCPLCLYSLTDTCCWLKKMSSKSAQGILAAMFALMPFYARYSCMLQLTPIRSRHSKTHPRTEIQSKAQSSNQHSAAYHVTGSIAIPVTFISSDIG